MSTTSEQYPESQPSKSFVDDVTEQLPSLAITSHDSIDMSNGGHSKSSIDGDSAETGPAPAGVTTGDASAATTTSSKNHPGVVTSASTGPTATKGLATPTSSSSTSNAASSTATTSASAVQGSTATLRGASSKTSMSLKMSSSAESGSSAVAAFAQSPPSDPMQGPVGCYLVFEPTSGGRLMLHYSRGEVPSNAVGFFCCGKGRSIQGFKFKQAGGRSELIKGIAGGDSNRRKYYVGWCQFLKLAKAKAGRVIQFDAASRQGVHVDVYGYIQKENHPEVLPLEIGLIDISVYDAVAVVPKHHQFLRGVKSIAMNNFLEMGNIAGATTSLTK